MIVANLVKKKSHKYTSTLSKANFDPSKYAGHSFRRGAATDLYNDGVSQ